MAIQVEVISDVGLAALYHRIENVEIDFNLNQVHIIMASYTNESYRNLEKADKTVVENKVSRLFELQLKGILSKEESLEMLNYSLPQLTADSMNIKSRILTTQKYTLPLTEDIRTNLYTQIVLSIPQFVNAIEA